MVRKFPSQQNFFVQIIKKRLTRELNTCTIKAYVKKRKQIF